MIQKVLRIDFDEYMTGDVVKEYWVNENDETPAARLVVNDNLELVLEDENQSSVCEDIEQADDAMEPLMSEWRNERITEGYDDLKYCGETFFFEDAHDLRNMIEDFIGMAEGYIEDLRKRGETNEQIENYIATWNKIRNGIDPKQPFKRY